MATDHNAKSPSIQTMHFPNKAQKQHSNTFSSILFYKHVSECH